ncbi:recombinase family protein [Streptomyces sp. NPDC047028]|uniref:recombinase family protein n=1 Tax=Streptomyces sp. NPDC047028 TaxID=3155793 RepID=UPI00340A2D35
MVKDPREWPVLRTMIESALRGSSRNDIARDLNARDAKTAAGNRWSGATVRQALTNPVMCGYRAIKGSLVRDPVTGEPVVGQWDAPATVAEWRALVDLSRQRGARQGSRMTNGSPRPGRQPQSSRKYLFSGYLRCGATRKDGSPCNSRMGGCIRPTAKDPANAVYVCTALDCAGTARNVRDVDAHLEGVVLRLLRERRTSCDAGRPDWTGAALLDDLRRQLAASPAAEHSVGTAGLQTRISGLEAAREAYHQRLNAAEAGQDPSRWPGMTLEQRRASVGRVLESVTVHPLPPGRSRRAPFDPVLLLVKPLQAG